MSDDQLQRHWGRWAYPRLEDIPIGPPEVEPPPPLHALKTLFDWAYLTLPAHVWRLRCHGRR